MLFATIFCPVIFNPFQDAGAVLVSRVRCCPGPPATSGSLHFQILVEMELFFSLIVTSVITGDWSSREAAKYFLPFVLSHREDHVAPAQQERGQGVLRRGVGEVQEVASWPEGARGGGEEGAAEREDWGGGQQEGEQGAETEEEVQEAGNQAKGRGEECKVKRANRGSLSQIDAPQEQIHDE